MFDATVHAGDLLTVGTVALGGLSVFFSMRATLQKHTDELSGIQQELKKLAEVLIANARTDERVTAAVLRITALEARANAPSHS